MGEVVVERVDVAVDGASVAVDVMGSAGPTVVCWPGGSRPGRDLIPLGQELVAAGYRPALIYPRGCHESPGEVESLSLHELAADAAVVIEALDAAPAFVAGHAFGNRVMRCLAADRPELVAGVVLMAAGGIVPPENLDDLAIVRDRDAPLDERRDALRRAYFEPTGDPDAWLESSGPGAGRLYRTFVLPPLEEWWTAGDAPMLIVQGGADRAAPPANGEMLVAEVGERAELVTIADAAHALPVERPIEVASHIVAWLGRQG